MPIISKETWDKFTQEEKEKVIKDYHNSAVAVRVRLEAYFGKENLLPQLTYEDVARELFKDKEFFIYDSENDVIVPELRPLNKPINCTSRKQAEKLLAINKLLNVAAYLNKNEDGTPWKPDWSDRDTSKWSIELDNRDNKLYPKSFLYSNHSIVYFPNMETTEKAIQILGEDTVRLALDSNY